MGGVVESAPQSLAFLSYCYSAWNASEWLTMEEYVYREYNSRGTLRCDMMIFVGKNTRYPDVESWFISTTGFCFPDTYRKAARKALRRLRVVHKYHLQRTPMGFFPPTEGRGCTWIARMRGLGREEEDLEDTVSHLSIYLTDLDQLYKE